MTVVNLVFYLEVGDHLKTFMGMHRKYMCSFRHRINYYVEFLTCWQGTTIILETQTKTSCKKCNPMSINRSFVFKIMVLAKRQRIQSKTGTVSLWNHWPKYSIRTYVRGNSGNLVTKRYCFIIRLKENLP